MSAATDTTTGNKNTNHIASTNNNSSDSGKLKSLSRESMGLNGLASLGVASSTHSDDANSPPSGHVPTNSDPRSTPNASITTAPHSTTAINQSLTGAVDSLSISVGNTAPSTNNKEPSIHSNSVINTPTAPSHYANTLIATPSPSHLVSSTGRNLFSNRDTQKAASSTNRGFSPSSSISASKQKFSARGNTPLSSASHPNPNPLLFPHPTPYYQKKIIFACNNTSNRVLTQLVLRLGRLHRNGYMSRYHADILLRMMIEEYIVKETIDEEIFHWHPQINTDLIPKEDLKVVYDARVERLMERIQKERFGGEDSSPQDSKRK